MNRVAIFGTISQINDHLYLSGAGVLKPEKLKQKKIQCIVNATTEETGPYFSGIDLIRIRIEDNPYTGIGHYFDMVADKIRTVKERGGSTLVHCVAGVSRSATLCLAYLIKHERMTLRQAYHYVKSARPIIRPNVGFWAQLVEYERKLRGHSTVSMIHVDFCEWPIPDLYSNDLLKHMSKLSTRDKERGERERLQERSSPGHRTRASALLSSGEYSKRRGYSTSAMDVMRSRSAADRPKTTSSSASASSLFGTYNPWRTAASLAALSPAPHRRRQENVFSNLYHSSREPFFSAF